MDELWNASLFAHLPGVFLEDEEPFPVGQGKVRCLSFDEWRQLDDEFPNNDRQFERSRPVFYTFQAELPADQDESYRTVKPWIDQLYRSFLLAPGAPLLPNPAFSVTYIQVDPETDAIGSFVIRHIGAFEREWIVFGGKINYRFTNEDLAEIRRAYHILEAVTQTGAHGEAEAGLHMLELTARPEFWWDPGGGMNRINGFVHCLAAVEEILLPEGEDGKPGVLTETFGRHAAVLTSASRDQFEAGVENFSNLYRLRSRLVHGQINVSNMDDADWEKLLLARPLLQYVLLYLTAYRRQVPEGESFPSLLSRAYDDAQAYRQFFKNVNEGFRP